MYSKSTVHIDSITNTGERLKIELQPISRNVVLPIDYQYALGGFIYNTLAEGNPDFALWLHNNGYGYDNKRFKFFSYSLLAFEKYTIQGDRIITSESPVTFQISTFTPEICEYLVSGIFRKQIVELGDAKSSAKFQISRVELLDAGTFNNETTYKLITPCVISSKTERGTTYWSPADTENIEYDKFMINNLINKYFTITSWLEDEKERIAEKMRELCEIQILSEPRSKLVTIKKGTRAETKVRGFLYTFKLKAPIELHRIGYYAGFGEKNSMGFGWGERVNN